VQGGRGPGRGELGGDVDVPRGVVFGDPLPDVADVAGLLRVEGAPVGVQREGPGGDGGEGDLGAPGRAGDDLPVEVQVDDVGGAWQAVVDWDACASGWAGRGWAGGRGRGELEGCGRADRLDVEGRAALVELDGRGIIGGRIGE